MPRSEYMPRICDDELAFQLECAGAVVVQGPKWCGKTRTSGIVSLLEVNGLRQFDGDLGIKLTSLR